MLRLTVPFLLAVPLLYSTDPVKINPAQVAIFLRDAEAVGKQQQVVNALPTQLESQNEFLKVRNSLARSVSDAVLYIEKTRSALTATGLTPQQRDTSTVCLDDITAHYRPIQRAVTTLEPPQYRQTRSAAVRQMENHRLAYLFVSQHAILTFDLHVGSTPPGATISSKRIGEPYATYKDNTNTDLSNLPLAIWTIRVQKTGYKDQEKIHDPYREKYPVVQFDLEKQ